MPRFGSTTSVRGLADTIDRIGATRPDIVLMAPLMVYILLLGLVVAVPPTWQPVAIAARGVASVAVVVAFRRHLPPWGRAHWPIAIFGGAFVAWGWVVGQGVFDHFGLGGHLPIMPGEKLALDPRGELGVGDLFRTTWILRFTVAAAVVPVVEEIFWRAFLLRALIDWHNFEKIPLGTFTWMSFLGTSLISTLQHPDNWGVSILCWMAFNCVFYWTRSIFCLVLLHGFTNVVLYLIVLRVGDWSHW